ncbi:MAG: HAMP domain-containing histidine kinase [Gracilibacteraceae bacterium]|jgi:signal transduction histidine kinase|nr:HAMP domain-containing histidine kinase [Gracilibacteraceae bacterium]
MKRQFGRPDWGDRGRRNRGGWGRGRRGDWAGESREDRAWAQFGRPEGAGGYPAVNPWYFLLALCALALCFTAAFYLGRTLFGERFSRLASFLLMALIGFIIFFLAAHIAGLAAGHLKGGRGDDRRYHFQLLEAMDRIAHGDFNVFVAPDAYDIRYLSIAHGLNEMARNLGTLENMRQDFISNVSHEIQSPLTSISGFAALLRDETLPAEKRAHYLGVIEAESRRLSSLSDNLLKLSALDAGDKPPAPRLYRLDKQLTDIALMLEPQWNAKNITLEAELPKTEARGDEALLSQVWVNLLHNAIKFTPAGGRISLTLTATGPDIICRISDNGPGIGPEDIIHIFERFYKADKARDRSLGGSGLGLSLVKKIVELHGGRVEAESVPGEGTTFSVILPGLISSV